MNGHAMYAEVENLGADDQIIRHASLVKRIACHLLNRLPPTVQVDDLIQAGMVGLLEAAGNFNSEMGNNCLVQDSRPESFAAFQEAPRLSAPRAQPAFPNRCMWSSPKS